MIWSRERRACPSSGRSRLWTSRLVKLEVHFRICLKLRAVQAEGSQADLPYFAPLSVSRRRARQ